MYKITHGQSKRFQKALRIIRFCMDFGAYLLPTMQLHWFLSEALVD